jgi:hypothetical protein
MYLSEVNGKGGIYAKVVSASVSNGIPISTLELRYPRFIHSEFMTHRMFSRNASSSRAIPVKRILEQVRNDPAMPIHWGKNRSGMQAREELSERDWRICQTEWYSVSDRAAQAADFMMYFGLHKQVINRILEPFQFITVVVTATEWDNFFKLRLHPDAQPEIQELARCMKEAIDSVEPVELELGEWHLPYVKGLEHLRDDAIKLSVARCARVSYLNHDKSNPDIKKDLELADRLLKAGHMSPFEHQATPMPYTNTEECYDVDDNLWWEWEEYNGITHADKNWDFWSGNFRGWIQHRQVL